MIAPAPQRHLLLDSTHRQAVRPLLPARSSPGIALASREDEHAARPSHRGDSISHDLPLDHLAGLLPSSVMARDICAQAAWSTVSKETNRGNASAVDLPVPGRTEHSDGVLCRASFVWNLRLWGRDR